MKIAIKDIKPNPFKKYINEGKLNPEKIELIKESIEKSGFWDNVICRKNKSGEYELAYGHHRIESAKRVFGKDYIVDIPVKDLSDEQMVIILANENNMQNEDYAIYQVDTVKMAKEFLDSHPQLSTVYSPGHGAQKDSTRAISNFLGDKNWSQKKVSQYLRMADQLHPEILKEMKNATNTSNHQKKKEGEHILSVAHAREIVKLPPKDQLPMAKKVQKYKLSSRETEYAVKVALGKENPIIRSDKPKIEVFNNLIKKYESVEILTEIYYLIKNIKNKKLEDYPISEHDFILEKLDELSNCISLFRGNLIKSIEV